MTVLPPTVARRPLSVVHLTTGLELGGAELMLSRLVRSMKASPVTARVVSMTGEGEVGAELREAGIEVHTLGMTRGQLALRPVMALRRWLRAWQPDVLSTWMYHADLLGTIATVGLDGPRLVWNLRASHIDMRHYRWLSSVTRRACVALSHRPALVIANSQAGRAAHEALGYRPRVWRVVANGIDTERFRPRPEARDEVRRELRLPDDALLVSVFARLDPMKGHDVFAAALAEWLPRDPHVHALVAGTGISPGAVPYAPLLRAHPAVRSRVHLLGPRLDVERLMAAADLACCPSRSEGFANSVAEAMACGLPCVVTDVGDVADLVGDRALVVAPDNARALALCLEAVSRMPDAQRREIGRTARARIVSRYSMETAAEAYLSAFEEVACAGRL